MDRRSFVCVAFTVCLGLLESCLGATLRVQPAGLLSSCPLTVEGAECPGVTPKGKLLSATFNGTCSGPVIVLKKGTEVSVDFHFHPDVAETKLSSKVHAKIGWAPWIPFPLGNPDACVDSGLKCPLKPKVDVDFAPALAVKTVYPTLDAIIIKWALVDGNGDDVFCLTIPARIVN